MCWNWNRNNKKKKKKHEQNPQIVLLKITNNDYELTTIKTLLDQNGIPYITKDKGCGGYLRISAGTSIYGTDIFVHDINFDRAKELITSTLASEI